MPPFETMDRYQYAVLYPFTGRYDGKGNPIVSSPVEIRVQWDYVDKTIRRDKDTILSVGAEVLVDRDIPIHSAMVEGRLDDWGSLGTGSTKAISPNVQIMEVVKMKKIPDINNRNYERIVSLSRYNKKLPTLQA